MRKRRRYKGSEIETYEEHDKVRATVRTWAVRADGTAVREIRRTNRHDTDADAIAAARRIVDRLGG